MRRLLLPLVLLAAACGRAPEAPPSAGGNATLEAPTPSSVTLAGMLSVVSTGYSNSQQAQYLQEEAKRLGISKLDKPSGETGRSEGPPPDPVTYEEGIERTKDMTKQFAAQRRAMEKGKPKTLDLDGSTPTLITGKPQGGPLEAEPDEGPKDLEKK